MQPLISPLPLPPPPPPPTALPLLLPGVDFSEACIKHDECYRTLGADRAQCDQKFLEDMTAECESSLK